jgi:hypothetical protein
MVDRVRLLSVLVQQTRFLLSLSVMLAATQLGHDHGIPSLGGRLTPSRKEASTCRLPKGDLPESG